MDCLTALGKQISKILEKGETLLDCYDILAGYCGKDWSKYECFCCEKYSRNPIYKDDNVEILLLCWDVDQFTPIHDHPDKGCLVKVIKGSLIEENYIKCNDNYVLKDLHRINVGDISYQEGKYGIHRIKNDGGTKACTLHIYAPPNYKFKKLKE